MVAVAVVLALAAIGNNIITLKIKRMNAQQKYRLIYVGKIIFLIPLLVTSFVLSPIIWIITGTWPCDWVMDEYLKYKEPKKRKNPTQAIVGQGEERELWNRSQSLRWPPPKPIQPPKPNTTNTNIDPYEY